MINATPAGEILKIGIEITTEKNKSRLLEKMLNKAMEISGCDAGTLYIVKEEKLYFKIMKTLSMNINKGANDEEIDLPPVDFKEENVCAYSAIHKELINIANVYESDRFDFSGPKRYDGITGYHTQSMLVIPMEDAESKIIGVIQLINKLDEAENIIPFSSDDAFILRSLGSMAAVSLSNMIYLEDIKHQMQSFVEAFATAVDKRTPYNGSHTRMVTYYAILVAKRLNELYESGMGGEKFDATRIDQLSLAAGLHDIGKMIIPLSVMNKSTRLGDLIDRINGRFNYLELLYERDMLKGRISAEAYALKIAEIASDRQTVADANTAGFLSDELTNRIGVLASHFYDDGEGMKFSYASAEELDRLLIKKGTLNSEERKIMESHVDMTSAILDQVYFIDSYKSALRFASEHHELLDGSGYPAGLSGDQLSTETRILTAVDIFDALTCKDRPYKKPMPRDRAISILNEMVGEGKLDGTVVSALADATVGME